MYYITTDYHLKLTWVYGYNLANGNCLVDCSQYGIVESVIMICTFEGWYFFLILECLFSDVQNDSVKGLMDKNYIIISYT